MTRNPTLGLDYIDKFIFVDLAIVLFQLFFRKADFPVDCGKNCVILANGCVLTSEKLCPTLSDDYIAGLDSLSAEDFYSKSLGY